MFELELKNPDELLIKCKDKTVAINIAQSTVNADLKVGVLAGAGEFEIGDVAITGIALKDGGIMYRVQVGGVKLGLVGGTAQMEDLDNLGPIDILGTSNAKIVSVVEPKALIPMGNMDFAEVKATVKVEKRIKIKNSSSLPATLEIWKLD
jgi:hypothetical protein